ncbi:MAG: hypothetical protein U0470_13555 [Anaerolineae bacterium]
MGLGDGRRACRLPSSRRWPRAGDGWFGAHVGARRGLRLFDIDQLESEGGASVDAAGTTSLAEAFLRGRRAARGRGHFEEAGPALPVRAHPSLAGRGGLPGPRRGPRHRQYLRGPRALPPMKQLPLDAAALHLCRDQLGAWTLDA